MPCTFLLRLFPGTSALFVPRDLPICAGLLRRFIHARAEQTPWSERRRKTGRSVERFSSPGRQGNLSKTQSNFVLSPTQQPGPKETAKLRKALQMSDSSEGLVLLFERAVKAGSADATVFGAAMQRCGQSRWWDALHAIRSIGAEAQMKLEGDCLNHYLTALAKSIRKEGGRGGGIDLERQRKLLPLAKEAWNAAGEGDIGAVSFGAALKVCEVSHEGSGLVWARELWGNVRDRNSVHYETFAQVLEQNSQRGCVNELLRLATTGVWIPTHVGLGALVDISARHRDWQRAEELWRTLVTQLKVKPGVIEYTALAKAHLLCGRPSAVVRVVESIPKERMKPDSILAEIHVQALLIVYHSSLEEKDRIRLAAALEKWRPLMERQSSAWQKRTWQKMETVAQRLCQHPNELRLKDVLVEWKATQSDMAAWNNHAASSRYLSDA